MNDADPMSFFSGILATPDPRRSPLPTIIILTSIDLPRHSHHMLQSTSGGSAEANDADCLPAEAY
ncbi:hypothetical protein [Cryobacterium sp. Hz9]|uniref:hypothetical protein n=1 Tax=Cryobacterium sp. Hz9 TaxID=1259167 RepID=UPI00141AA464|nr:hypothetical protein [Cryobacterium sp. Hz9]